MGERSAATMRIHRDVVAALMASQHHTAESLAREAGVSASSVRQVLRGDRERLRPETAAALARALHVTAEVIGVRPSLPHRGMGVA